MNTIQTTNREMDYAFQQWNMKKQNEERLEQVIKQIEETGKLPKIVDLMLEKCMCDILVKPEYVAMTPDVLKKWWLHKNEKQKHHTGHGDCDDLFESQWSQDLAEEIWGIKRCFPCSLALSLIWDIRKGINVDNPSAEELETSNVMYLANEYGNPKK